MFSRYNIKPLKKTIIEVFIPTFSQIIFFISLALVLLGIVFFEQIFAYLNGGDAISQTYFDQTISTYIQNINEIKFAEYISSIVFWSIAGAIFYIGLVSLINVILIFGNNVETRKKENLKGLFDKFSLVDEYRRVIWIFVFLVLFVMSFSKFIPIWFTGVKSGVSDSNLILVLFTILFLSYNLYLLYMFGWTMLRNPNILARN